MCREDQELQGRHEAASDSFRTKLLTRRGLFAWRQAHAQLQQLQVPSGRCLRNSARTGASDLLSAWRLSAQSNHHMFLHLKGRLP